MAVNVTNKTGEVIKACLNRWGTSGETGWFKIKNGETEKWHRTDTRGFLLIVQRGRVQNLLYYVRADLPVTLYATQEINATKIELSPEMSIDFPEISTESIGE